MSGDRAKSRTRAVWGESPAGWTHAREHEVGSREFFEQVISARFGRELAFLRSVVPFSEYRGRDVLEIGCGAGYDAWEFCRHGARYVGIDITPDNPRRTRQHLGYYSFLPPLFEADGEALPFRDASFELVFSNGVLHHTPDMEAAFREARRVLRPGGQFCVILYHRDSVFQWVTLGADQHVLRGGWRHMSFAERLSRIEDTGSEELPLVRTYSRRQVRRVLARAGFDVESVKVRKLLPEDMPRIPKLGVEPWTRVPQRALDAVGRVGGWYVVAFGRVPS